jgi:tRNA(Arg) A34 adenosine deaminase TadA
MTNTHETFMQICIQLSKLAVRKGNHPFGALLVNGNTILLEAENTINTDHDITRHAELNLVSQASQTLDIDTLMNSTLYTSTEPCPMCAGAIYWANIGAVVYGCSVEALARVVNGGLQLPCREVFARGSSHVEVIGPLLEHEALHVHKDYWK